jgi:hypothetical protein
LGAYQIFKMPSLEIRVSTVTHFERSAMYFPHPSSRSSLDIQDPLAVKTIVTCMQLGDGCSMM